MDSVAAAINRKVTADRYECALHRRKITLNRSSTDAFRHAVLLKYGRGSLAKSDDIISFDAPSLVWSCTGQGDVLQIETGSEALIVGANNDLIVEAVGPTAESVILRYMLDRSFVVPIGDSAKQLSEYESCFNGIADDLERGDAGSWMLLAAYFRIIIVNLWRATGVGEVAAQAMGGNSALLQKFRQLVEMHFREHWPIRAYSEAVGVSHDRLHAICTRELKRAPLQLVHDRLAYEAQLLLDRSVLSIDQISESLGFRDASGFSHFFKRRIGMPPSSYRNMAAAGRGDPFNAPDRGFADWP
ncbi:MAG: AraC family transcriptional regulator [Alphaproteobacteria bacterium]|nr:AraC family transcriptional regulator [Alphaproteobacteria bacterium]